MPLRAARRATAFAFGIQGFIFISLTTRIPHFAARWSLDELKISVGLLGVVLLAGLGSVVAEQVSTRVDSAWVLRAGLGLMAVVVPLVCVAPTLWMYAAALGVYGIALGLVDATTNMQAVAVEHAYERPILPSFHGAWTLGGIIGAGLTLALPELFNAGLALIALAPLLGTLMPYLRRVSMPAEPAPEEAVPWRELLLVGLAMVLFYMVDTASTTWGPTYLDRTFDTPSELVALATFPYLVASLIARIAGDGLVHRYGPVVVLRAGAVLASISLAIIVAAPTWPIAVIGFTTLGLGAAVMAPLSFSAAGRLAGAGINDPSLRQLRVDGVIARFNQFNYAGALIGAVMTGVIGADNLRWGFAVPMVLILAVWPLAKAFRAPETASVP